MSFRDYLSDRDLSGRRDSIDSLEHELIVCYCEQCWTEVDCQMEIDWDLRGEDLPDCPRCGEVLEMGELEPEHPGALSSPGARAAQASSELGGPA